MKVYVLLTDLESDARYETPNLKELTDVFSGEGDALVFASPESAKAVAEHHHKIVRDANPDIVFGPRPDDATLDDRWQLERVLRNGGATHEEAQRRVNEVYPPITVETWNEAAPGAWTLVSLSQNEPDLLNLTSRVLEREVRT